jgi:hypothetical protein
MRVSKHRTALLVLTMLLAVGALAPTALGATVTYDGQELLVDSTGDNFSHELRFRLDTATNRDHIIDSQPLDGGGGCAYETVDETWMSCPGSPDLRVDLGGGNDSVNFSAGGFLSGDCFNNYLINLGNGSNSNILNSACAPGGDVVLTAGSGNDTLQGGPAGTSSAIFAGGGSDKVNPSVISGLGDGGDVVYGGEGEDILLGEGGNDDLFGEGGHDEVLGSAGNDVEDGGPGDDFIGYYRGAELYDNDQGADTYRGGSGHDSLILQEHVGGMAISPDGVANDGEGDNVGSDFELYVGTGDNDVFRGNAAPNHFDGGGGNDESHGAGGDDYIEGGDGNSTIFGDAGNDFLEGGTGADRIEGGSGSDKLYAVKAGCKGYDCDFHLGDALFAVDGEADTADCSGGGTANVDQFDVATGLCNRVNRVSVAAAGGGGALAKASFRGSKRSINVSRSGRFTYSFRAAAGGKASFRSVKKVRVSKRARVTLASKSFKKPKRGKVKLKIKLSRKKLRILRRNRRIKTKVTVKLKSGGRSSTASTTVTLKR